MTATPADVARYTQDGVVVSQEDAALRANHPDAIDGGNNELEMFYDDPADADIILAERFDLLSQVSALHEGIEVNESLGFGASVAISPTVPCFRVIDAVRGIDTVARTRAYVYEAAGDNYSVEVLE
jgi:hypothetical protein